LLYLTYDYVKIAEFKLKNYTEKHESMQNRFTITQENSEIININTDQDFISI